MRISTAIRAFLEAQTAGMHEASVCVVHASRTEFIEILSNIQNVGDCRDPCIEVISNMYSRRVAAEYYDDVIGL